MEEAAARPVQYGFEGFLFHNRDNCCWLDSLLFSLFACSNELDAAAFMDAPLEDDGFDGEESVRRVISVLPELRNVLTSAREYRTDNERQFQTFLDAVTAATDEDEHPGEPLARAEHQGEVLTAGPVLLRALGVPEFTTANKLCVRYNDVEYCKQKPAGVLARLTAAPCQTDADVKAYILRDVACPPPDRFEDRLEFDNTFETGAPLRVSLADRLLFRSEAGALLSEAAEAVPLGTSFPSREEVRIRRDSPVPEVLAVAVNRNVEGTFSAAEINVALADHAQTTRLEQILPTARPRHALLRDDADLLLPRLQAVRLARTYTREVPIPVTIDLGDFISDDIPAATDAPQLRYTLRSVIRYVAPKSGGGPKPSQLKRCLMTFNDGTPPDMYSHDLGGHYISSSRNCGGGREAVWTTYDDLRQGSGPSVQNGNLQNMGQEAVFMIFIRDPVAPGPDVADD
eukprot:GILJ01000249.1.p1 GENE.GILJ01000249.1~~GILJ01000249.1.p1  ORF type:complete len:531 (+),score=79.57 GILJ01000249.1:224-1594(+)